MRITIELDYELLLGAIEIHNVAADADLPAKLLTKLPPLETPPEGLLLRLSRSCEGFCETVSWMGY